jgi:hypothetical protein
VSSVTFELRNLNQFIVELRSLPAELKGDATTIVVDAAHKAQAEIVAAYPVVTGNLRKGVKVTIAALGPAGVDAVVRSSAPHAWLYEHGRSRWGEISDPPAPVFIPTMMRMRRAMYARLAQLLEQHGLDVTER